MSALLAARRDRRAIAFSDPLGPRYQAEHVRSAHISNIDLFSYRQRIVQSMPKQRTVISILVSAARGAHCAHTGEAWQPHALEVMVGSLGAQCIAPEWRAHRRH